MKAKSFDSKFDAGDAVIEHLDIKRARRSGTDSKKVNVDFPAWMVESLDHEARRRMGVARQSLIKLWLADRLTKLASAVKR